MVVSEYKLVKQQRKGRKIKVIKWKIDEEVMSKNKDYSKLNDESYLISK